MNYYRILDDLYKPIDKWFLGYIESSPSIKSIELTKACPSLNHVNNSKYYINIREEGTPTNISFTDDDVMIVDQKAADCFVKFRDVQLIPIKVRNFPANVKHYIVLILNEADCLDESRSSFDTWEPGNQIRPDLAGKYKTLYKLRLQKNNIKYSIFRLKKYDIAIIVNEIIKTEIEKQGLNGLVFQKV